MTLTEQFPDVSMLLRAKRKLNLKHNATGVFQDMRYSPISLEQKFYEKTAREKSYKYVVYLALTFTAVLYFVLNGRSILKWMAF